MVIEPFDWIGNFNKKQSLFGLRISQSHKYEYFILSNDVGFQMSIWLND